MDVVYPLKRSGGLYRELKFSMRSLRNLPHRNVYLVGGCPPWARNVRHLEAEQQPTKYLDAKNNIRTACLSDEVSDPFILMNDDFFIMDPIDSVPVLNRGTVRDVIASYERNSVASQYLGGMRSTLKVLEDEGYPDPWSFEMHTPTVLHKQMTLKSLDMGARYAVWHRRTAYGALALQVGETVADVKVHDMHSGFSSHLPFVSTSDEAFKVGRVGHQIRSRHADPSEYELSTVRGVR